MRRGVGWLLLGGALAVCAAARLLAHRSLEGSLQWGWSEAAASLRWNALLSAVVAGAALSSAGMLLQGMLRNPLASPFVLGLSGGAQAAVALATLVAVRAGALLAPGVEVTVASVGAAVALLACMAFGRSRDRGIDPVSLVLAGVVVAAVAGSVATLCEWLLPPAERSGLLAWGLGRIPEAPAPSLLWGGGVAVAACTAAASGWGRHLDAMQLSDDEARAIGVSLGATRIGVVLVASVLAALATALCGPLAFVGLVGPHAARSLVGGAHRRAMPAALLAGATLLVLADVVRMLVPVAGGGRMPVGVVCALAGGPAFLVLLRRGAVRHWSP